MMAKACHISVNTVDLRHSDCEICMLVSCSKGVLGIDLLKQLTRAAKAARMSVDCK